MQRPVHRREIFAVRDLHELADDLIRGEEKGKLSVITKHGAPVFLAVLSDAMLVREGVTVGEMEGIPSVRSRLKKFCTRQERSEP